MGTLLLRGRFLQQTDATSYVCVLWIHGLINVPKFKEEYLNTKNPLMRLCLTLAPFRFLLPNQYSKLQRMERLTAKQFNHSIHFIETIP